MSGYPKLLFRVKMTKREQAEYKMHRQVCDRLQRVFERLQERVTSPYKA